MTPLFLSRLQFGLTISFHYIFPQLSIGLALILILMELTWLRTDNPVYKNMTQFWIKIFALIFAIGVATGIVMEFQFGTNWSNFSRFVGDVFGSALASEGIFAFFLESGFLAVLIFGANRVSKPIHFLSTCLVAAGSTFSAIWIMVANSWMQTPGEENTVYKIVTTPFGQTRAEAVSFWAVVFSPSSLDRLWHTVVGAWQSGAWLVISVAAYYLLKNRHTQFAKTSLKIALSVALAASVMQLFSGHRSAEIISEYQPAKLAAFEGHWHTGPADMFIMGTTSATTHQTHGLYLPGFLSYLVKDNFKAPVAGLDQFGQDIPPVAAVFQTYHFMVAIGMTLIALSLLGVFFWWRQSLWTKKWFLRICVVAVILPQAANQLGWFSAEAGRQPWLVYGLLRTADGVSPHLNSPDVWASGALFAIMYLLLGSLFIFLLNHKIKHGPDDPDATHTPHDIHLLQGDRAGV